ncbi:SgcJ/EcaC family oxidoreductase [Streptantibioticus rubrisoli]|uniref:SgcJ/EcaC family oxidoreductase n=1 Tax=Streptantibioticus rubrisoli TaxID=1387313 RepID=A0ABT1PCB9_9ACTN|nr:SgcJ/EcaC family oxidoreductase [Streptantibioticus rubrisoli]MCQ4043017.1 SgcJ/EcaC family oxidoreductase [Streptantibioticus rubrisoli]
MRRMYTTGVAAAATAVLLTGAGPTCATAIRAQPRATQTATTQLPSRGQIAALFDQWNAALATGDPSRVADLYAPDAVLLPTVSDRIRTNRAEIVDYFRHFLESKPVGRIQRRVINILGPTAAVDTGLYQFTLTKANGTKSKVDARYTFVYALRGGRWLIINHHSSVLPTGS